MKATDFESQYAGCVLSLKTLEKPGKPKCLFPGLEKPGKCPEDPGKALKTKIVKNCKSLVIIGTSILYVKIFFAPPARPSTSHTEFYKCRAKNDTILSTSPDTYS